jgi:hypothetical protein
MATLSRWRRLSRFSLGGLLFVTLCTCVYLGSYRVGNRVGAQQQYDESFFIKTYNINDLLIEAESPAQRDEILASTAERIRSTVSPQSWMQPGEPPAERRGEIAEMPAVGTLVVSQYGLAHDQIVQALKQLRRERLQASTEQALVAVAKLEQRSSAQPAVLVSYSPRNFAETRGALLNRFADLTEELTSRWGTPAFAGQCTDEGFPAWSAAQALVCWPRRGGDLYLAVQNTPGVGEAVVAGWHADN